MAKKESADPYLGMGVANYNLLFARIASQFAPKGQGSDSQLLANPQSNNYTLGATDQGKAVQFTGSSAKTFGFIAAATLGDGWWCYIENKGTASAAVTLDPSGSETIDGLTSFKMYPGEARLVWCNGSSFSSIVLRGFEIQFDTSGTFTVPPGYKTLEVEGWGAGGGGGSGAKGAAGTNRNGGAGGGGGAYNRFQVETSLLGATESIGIGAGGTGGAVQTVNTTAGNDGTDGGNSTFGSLHTFYGGGGGPGGPIGAPGNGGAGGGTIYDADLNNPGAPVPPVPPGDNGMGGASGGDGGGDGWASDWGGGGGAVSAAAFTTAGSGGGSMHGGPGGGGGGFIDTLDNAYTGLDGGSQNQYSGGGGTAASPDGNNGGDFQGGGGGSAYKVQNSGHGGNGGCASGGAGGGAVLNGFNSGAGGNGGNGRIIVRGSI